jgi:3-methyladenine DNA glycosylase/8-oxoguanine DNA glycosylase
MASPTKLERRRTFRLRPRAPFHFDANLHKPSHFPSSDNAWQPGRFWITMRWRGRRLGLEMRNVGSQDAPEIRLTVFSASGLSEGYLRGLLPEIAWRFNLNQDISEFTEAYVDDEYLGPAITRWRGMKPIAANSLYETLMIYVVLQNAVIRRSIQMLEALFDHFGREVLFAGKALSTFWTPQEMALITEDALRGLKVGYRAKTFLRITEPFAAGTVDERTLRTLPKDTIAQAIDRLYGVGPATLEYLLFEDFYFLDALRVIPPWERKIMSRLLFQRRLVPEERIRSFFRSRYPGFEKLAFHYLWEDLFWRREHESIEWLEREIRR